MPGQAFARWATIALLGAGIATAARGQEAKIPIERDLQRSQQIDRRLGIPEPSRRGSSSVTPDNPTGVAGFNGPPGTVGDSVNSYGPLPPGAAGNEQ